MYDDMTALRNCVWRAWIFERGGRDDVRLASDFELSLRRGGKVLVALSHSE